jgi:hypothetical protein
MDQAPEIVPASKRVSPLAFITAVQHGVGVALLPPQAYQLRYLNGARSYQEPVVVLRLAATDPQQAVVEAAELASGGEHFVLGLAQQSRPVEVLDA